MYVLYQRCGVLAGQACVYTQLIDRTSGKVIDDRFDAAPAPLDEVADNVAREYPDVRVHRVVV